nr:hypothetical protein [Escherichia coli]
MATVLFAGQPVGLIVLPPHDLPSSPTHRLRNAGWPLCAAMGGRAVTDRS